MQDAYISLWEKYGRKDSRQAPSLLYTIVRNKCLNYLKRRKILENLDPEAYILDVGKKGVSILSGSEAGSFYAFETLRQIRRPDGSIPCVHIEDAPAFDYRAMMLDCSRHFWTVEEIKGLLDVLASHKINTIRRIERFVRSKGRSIIGWDEI